MEHDEFCELAATGGEGCSCAYRAWMTDPGQGTSLPTHYPGWRPLAETMNGENW